MVIASCIWFYRADTQSRACNHSIYAHRVLVLNQTLVVSTQADQKQNTCDILETMNPFSSLALLTTDVDHEHLMVAQLEDRLSDSNCSGTSMHNVLLVGDICGIEKTVEVRKEIN